MIDQTVEFRPPGGPMIVHMTTDELLKHLERATEMTAQSLAYLAAVWVELERRGVDLTRYKMSLAPFLRDVATGALIPEVVLAFAGRRSVLRWLRLKPVEQQRRIAAGAPVEIALPDGSVRSVPASDLSIDDIRYLETGSRVRRRRQDDTRTSRARDHHVGFAVSRREYDSLTAAARQEGLTVSDYVRKRLKLSTVADFSMAPTT